MAGWVTFFKYASVVISAAAGVFALFVEYKNPDTKKISGAGWVALIFIVIAASIDGTTQYLEDRLKKSDADAAKAAADRDKALAVQNVERQLAATERALYPLTNVAMTTTIRLPIRSRYLTQMRSDLRSIFAEEPRPVTQPDGCIQTYVTYHDDSEALRFALDRCPGDWPNQFALKFVVDHHHPTLLVYDSTTKADQLGVATPLLTLSAPPAPDSERLRTKLQYEYNLTRDELLGEYPSVAAPPARLRVAAPIASFLDLAGKTLVVTLRPGPELGGEDAAAFNDILKNTAVESFALTVGQRTITLNESRLRHVRDRDGYPMAIHALPTSDRELLAYR